MSKSCRIESKALKQAEDNAAKMIEANLDEEAWVARMKHHTKRGLKLMRERKHQVD